MKKSNPIVYVVIDLSKQDGPRIPKASTPTYLHTSAKSAKAEAERLAALNHGQRFGVFRAIGIAGSEPVRVTWTKDMPEVPVLTEDTPF